MTDSPHLEAARRISSEVAQLAAMFRLRQATGPDPRPAELLPALERLASAACGLRDTVATAASQQTGATCEED